MRAICALLALTTVAACAHPRPDPLASFVEPGLQPLETVAIAADAAVHLADRLPPARTTIVLHAPRVATGTGIDALAERLRAAGFGVIVADRAGDGLDTGAIPLRYMVSQLEGGVLMRLQFAGREDARFYVQGPDQALRGASAFTNREPE